MARTRMKNPDQLARNIFIAIMLYAGAVIGSIYAFVHELPDDAAVARQEHTP